MEGQDIPEAPCFLDLTGSNLPQYLVSGACLPDEPEEKSHSTDSNSENAPGNDYGDTPSSSQRDDESGDDMREDSDDDENERKMKRLMRLMDKNKPSSDDEDDCDFGRARGGRGNYVSVAQDAWFNREDYDDY